MPKAIPPTADTLDSLQKLLYNGDITNVLDILAGLEIRANNDPALLTRIAEFYVICNRHQQALRCHEKAMALRPDDAAHVYNVAASCISIGDFDRAEELFNRVIYLKPDDYDAWQNRSTLRKQTIESNHVDQLKYVKQQMRTPDKGEVPVCFALAKELEDLGRYEESFAFLQEGSFKRKQQMNYNVAEDIATMEKIRSVFNRELLDSEYRAVSGNRPIFVLGLPRSGTTLVDRIISSHSQADSLGESNALAFAVMRASESSDSNRLIGDKLDLVERSAKADFDNLGKYYSKSSEGLAPGVPRLVDKTPLNFLYIGLIHLAMPGARIINLRRHPVDSCYAMYKTLFRMGYPFTYSLEDVGRYYIAYNQLMQHWRELIPTAFLDIDYEELVNNQESETRRILSYLELDWEDGCLDFHRHTGVAATASAAQVRQPIYSTSVGLWKRYQKQLSPFVARLKEHGIDVS